jgi:hypothetical protein
MFEILWLPEMLVGSQLKFIRFDNVCQRPERFICLFCLHLRVFEDNCLREIYGQYTYPNTINTMNIYQMFVYTQ